MVFFHFDDNVFILDSGNHLWQHEFPDKHETIIPVQRHERVHWSGSSHSGGNEMLDAGQVGFVDASLIDVRKSIGFQNLDLYCVAPITVGGRTLDSYDFWAVGLDLLNEFS